MSQRVNTGSRALGLAHLQFATLSGGNLINFWLSCAAWSPGRPGVVSAARQAAGRAQGLISLIRLL